MCTEWRARVCVRVYRFSFLMVNMVITQLCVPCTYVLCSIRYHFTVPWFVYIYIYIRSISIYVHTAWTRQFSGSARKKRGEKLWNGCVFTRDWRSWLLENRGNSRLHRSFPLSMTVLRASRHPSMPFPRFLTARFKGYRREREFGCKLETSASTWIRYIYIFSIDDRTR